MAPHARTHPSERVICVYALCWWLMMTKTSVALAEGLGEGSPCTRASFGRTGEPIPHTEVCGSCFLGKTMSEDQCSAVETHLVGAVREMLHRIVSLACTPVESEWLAVRADALQVTEHTKGSVNPAGQHTISSDTTLPDFHFFLPPQRMLYLWFRQEWRIQRISINWLAARGLSLHFPQDRINSSFLNYKLGRKFTRVCKSLTQSNISPYTSYLIAFVIFQGSKHFVAVAVFVQINITPEQKIAASEDDLTARCDPSWLRLLSISHTPESPGVLPAYRQNVHFGSVIVAYFFSRWETSSVSFCPSTIKRWF